MSLLHTVLVFLILNIAVYGQPPQSTTRHHSHHFSTTHGMHHSSLKTTHHHGTPVRELFYFAYDPHTHMMSVLVVNGHTRTCYIDALTHDEQLAVHTTQGLQHLELKLLASISTTNKTPITAAELLQMSSLLSHKCGGTHVTHAYKIDV